MPQNRRPGVFAHRGRRVPPWRVLAATTAAVLTLLASACGSEGDSGGHAGTGGHDGADVVADRPAAAGEVDLASLPEVTTYEEISDAPRDQEPDAGTNGEVVHPRRELVVHDAPGGKPIARLPVQQISSPTWVPVVDREEDWAQILLPTRPNGAVGWIDTADGAVESAQNDYVVNVDLDTFNLEILKGDEQIGEWTVGIGAPEHPTPTGRAFIIASIEEMVNDYSPIILPLSSHSESHTTYGGGPGTVGIHTWPDNSFVGNANSDGCIRVTHEALDELVKLPLGTIINVV